MTAKLASAGEWSGYWKGPARAGRRPAVFTGTDSGDPRPRGGPLHRSAAKKRPFLLDRPRPIFFSTRRKRKWGVEWTGYHHSRIPRAAGCRPYTSPRESPRREPVWGRPQSSHSPLWASHHAGNAGSFGERVTGILYLKPEFPFRVNGEIVFEPTPKWKNCKREPLFIVQISPR